VDETTGEQTDIRPGVEGDFFALTFAGETIPLQASWIAREAFFAIGGFDRQLVPAEDVDFMHRLSQLRSFARSEGIVSVVRVNHPRTSTTALNKQAAIWRQLPTRWIASPGTLRQLRTRTRCSPFWAGRCVRQCTVAVVRAILRWDLAATITGGCGVAVLAHRHLGAAPFWRAAFSRFRS